MNNWVISDFIIDVLVPAVGQHPFPLDELTLMVGAVTGFKPTHIFEWGTHIGKSARVFSETLEHFDIHGHIYSIDLPDSVEHVEHPHEQRGVLVRDKRNVTLIQGDGLGDSLAIVEREHPSQPMFFIDGDHSYQAVKYELGALISKFAKGIFLLHDTFYQSPESGYNIGPYRAICEILSEREVTHKSVSTNTGLPGMTLLYPA